MLRAVALRVTRPRVAVLSAVHDHPQADPSSIIGVDRRHPTTSPVGRAVPSPMPVARSGTPPASPTAADDPGCEIDGAVHTSRADSPGSRATKVKANSHQKRTTRQEKDRRV
jgi:hypothetical protein